MGYGENVFGWQCRGTQFALVANGHNTTLQKRPTEIDIDMFLTQEVRHMKKINESGVHWLKHEYLKHRGSPAMEWG